MTLCKYCGQPFSYRRNSKRQICYNPECKRKQHNEACQKSYQKNKSKYKEPHRKYMQRTREIRRKHYRNYRNALRKEVFQHYSPTLSCACCGETHFEFLQIDHIHGDGSNHRKRDKARDTILWLKKNNYPEGYQVLCVNCNFAKRDYDKQFCPVHHPELYEE